MGRKRDPNSGAARVRSIRAGKAPNAESREANAQRVAQTDWRARHERAFERGFHYIPNLGGVGGPMVGLIKCWIALAEQHEQEFETRIGDDDFACDP